MIYGNRYGGLWLDQARAVQSVVEQKSDVHAHARCAPRGELKLDIKVPVISLEA